MQLLGEFLFKICIEKPSFNRQLKSSALHIHENGVISQNESIDKKGYSNIEEEVFLWKDTDYYNADDFIERNKNHDYYSNQIQDYMFYRVLEDELRSNDEI